MTKKLQAYANKIININLHIKKIYDKLYEYEIKGENNPEKLNELIDNLNICNSVLNRCYKEGNLSISKCDELVNYISNKKSNSTEENMVFNKIIIDLDDIESILSAEGVIALNNEDYKHIKSLGYNNPIEFIRKVLSNKISIERALRTDVLSENLYFIEQLINNKNYKKYKDRLIYAKYSLCFISREIENLMINNSFKVPKEIYLSSKMVSEYLDSKDEYEIYRKNYAEEIAYSAIEDILTVKDEEYNKDNIIVNSLIKQSLLRAALLLLDDKSINDINYDFHALADEEENKEKSIGYIIDGFKSVNSDRNKRLVLSLNK